MFKWFVMVTNCTDLKQNNEFRHDHHGIIRMPPKYTGLDMGGEM